jgi:cell division protein FtsN
MRPDMNPGAMPGAKQGQRGGFVLGAVVGLLVGLALALGVALYITKAPIPFIDKVPQRTAEHDRAEAERNKEWNPNALLGSKSGPLGAPVPEPDAAASAAVTNAATAAASGPRAGVLPPPAPGAQATSPSGRDPAAILSGAPVPASVDATAPRSTAAPLDAFVYFVQTGAFTRSDDAEQQRVRLTLLGLSAKITEREQAGRTVYRVRVGPFPARGEADALVQRLQEQTMDAQIVRVERP